QDCCAASRESKKTDLAVGSRTFLLLQRSQYVRKLLCRTDDYGREDLQGVVLRLPLRESLGACRWRACSKQRQVQVDLHGRYVIQRERAHQIFFAPRWP